MRTVTKIEELAPATKGNSTGDYTAEIAFLESIKPLKADETAKDGRTVINGTIILDEGETLRGVSRKIGKAAELMGVHRIKSQGDTAEKIAAKGKINMRTFVDKKENAIHVQLFAVE